MTVKFSRDSLTTAACGVAVSAGGGLYGALSATWIGGVLLGAAFIMIFVESTDP